MKKKWIYTFLISIIVIISGIYFIFNLFYQNNEDKKVVVLDVREKKKEFLKEYGDVYGYGGILENIRLTQTPHMNGNYLFIFV
jgi:hypothetical protein